MENNRLTKFRLKNVEKLSMLVVPGVGSFKLATLNDQRAEQLFNSGKANEYIEKVEPEPEIKPEAKPAAKR